MKSITNVERKIKRMGNSYGTTYPQKVLEHLHVGDGITFTILDDGTVTI
ncbi:hypothetical protein [Sporolactobacillus pectinivorans]|nr:hypothetical protein [Sporolactobacillus pectinivorans]